MRAWLLLVVASCSRPSPGELDAGEMDAGFQWSLGAYFMDPGGVPQVDPPPTIFIDGIETGNIELHYASFEAADGEPHVVELRHGALVVASYPVAVNRGCSRPQDVPHSASDSLCAFSHGELRFFADQGTAMDAGGLLIGCVGDGFCLPACTPTSSASCSGARCTSIYASVDPIATHLGCAPIGPRAPGETCSLITDATGTHDDCGMDLLCVAGTCRRICDPKSGPPTGCTTCSFVLGHAPEVGICMP